MKLPYHWLKELVKTNLPAGKIAERLTLAGLEVESVEGGAHFDRVVIGQILEVKDHPNADKLHLTKVNVGLSDPLEIVCGANNLSVGIKVPVVLIGGHVAGFEIKKAQLRGVDSHGMICSEKELGLGEDHTGIMILDSSARIGQDFSEYAGVDQVIDVNVPANRPDCMGVIGLAREAAACLNEKMTLPNISVKTALKEGSDHFVDIEVADPGLCPRYVGWIVKDVKIASSPDWLAKKLVSAGVRPINNVVDISNYVMLETGQPLHFFDLTKLATVNGKAKIIVRRAKKVETLTTLDDQRRVLDTEMLVIADPKGAVAVAGVMGGENSEIDAKTKDILIEAAVFDKANIRKTARKLGLRSEASARFEKGLPETLPRQAIERAAQLLNELAGGKVAASPIDVLSNWIWIQHLGLSIEKLKRFLNFDLTHDEIIDILRRLEFEADRFDIVAEAKKHLGKPYLYGANFKKNGTTAFDCSYLTDYLYSLINVEIGHTSLAQIHHGWEVPVSELKPGDLVFYKGKIEKSTVDEYTTHDTNGNHLSHENKKYPAGVGHNGLYIGDGQVIHAAAFEYAGGQWLKKAAGAQKVEIVDLAYFTENPEFIGARRYVEDLNGLIAITVPWWRDDVRSEADIYEEIARISGYDRIPATLPDMRDRLPLTNLDYEFFKKIRHLLADIGLSEILTYPFVTAKEIEIADGDESLAIKLANPKVKEQEFLRLDLVSSMIKALAANQYNRDLIQFFEIGRGFKHVPKKALERETTYLCLGLKDDSTRGFYRLKGILDRILVELKLATDFEPSKTALFKTGQQANILLAKKSIGFIGEVDETASAFFGLKKPVTVLQLDLAPLKQAGKPKFFKPISKFPSVVRDISAVFALDVTVKSILGPLFGLDPLIEKIEVSDIFEGQPLQAGQKNITIRFSINSDRETLTDEQVEKVLIKCQNKINAAGGEIRRGRE